MIKTKIMIIGVMVGFILFLLIPVFEIDEESIKPKSIDSTNYRHNLYNKEHTKVLKLRTQNIDMKEHPAYYANNPVIIE